YVRAKQYFAAQLVAHPGNVKAKLGLAEAELGLTHYLAAETLLREVTAAAPEMWQAHKNLILVEAALGRWEEFNNERMVLRLARQRGAPGISPLESDVIDGFTVRGHRWIVREYFELLGRSQTRYNFEHFSPSGKAQEYISLDAANPFAAPGDALVIGAGNANAPTKHYSLNWISGHAHGTIKHYGAQEPSYEAVRADVLRWLRSRK
ncbi:MAG: hypothetical protein ABI142_08690, partial [Bryocella sp.]